MVGGNDTHIVKGEVYGPVYEEEPDAEGDVGQFRESMEVGNRSGPSGWDAHA